MNTDPVIGGSGNYNLFAYCSNNPVNYSDPTGAFILSFLASLTVFEVLWIATGVSAAVATTYFAVAQPLPNTRPAPKLTEIIPFPTPPSAPNNRKSKIDPIVPFVPVPRAKPQQETPKENGNYVVWYAHYDKASRSVVIDGGVEFDHALTFLMAGLKQSFMCADGNVAKRLTSMCVKRNYEIDKGKAGVDGYFYHYHPYGGHGDPHVWHYGGGLVNPY